MVYNVSHQASIGATLSRGLWRGRSTFRKGPMFQSSDTKFQDPEMLGSRILSHKQLELRRASAEIIICISVSY